MTALQHGQALLDGEARLADDRSQRADCQLSMHGHDHDPPVLGTQLAWLPRWLTCSKPPFRSAVTTWAPETTG